jgi:hypothetical protein
MKGLVLRVDRTASGSVLGTVAGSAKENLRVDETTITAYTADDEIPGVTDVELVLRARRVKQMTHGQYKAIRQSAIDMGLPPEAASNLPWLAADPQAMVSALRAAPSREEIIARGVLGIAIEADVMTSMIMRSLENMRAEEHRYRGTFRLPRYTSTDDNTALRADLSGQPSAAAAATFISEQLEVVDALINRFSPYGDDIRRNGIRRGGVLFPVVIDLPGEQRIGGFDSTDCYSRTLFAQHHSGITVSGVLESWLIYPPATPGEFRDHPLKAARDKLVAVAENIVNGEPVSTADRGAVLRAVMPKTTLVLKVRDTDGLGIDEIRRRLVSERHLDKQLEFTTNTKNETRAEAVITELARRGLLPNCPGLTSQDVFSLLENPREIIASRSLHRDDVAAAAAAVFLPQPRSATDRVIFPAIASRGVITPNERTNWLRSELAAQVITRAVEGGLEQRDLRKSALERALRNPRLRGISTIDDRPVADLLAAALIELREFNKARQRGESPTWGDAMQQLALRGGFYLFFGEEVALGRAPVGGQKGDDNREPNQIIETLGTLEVGLNQLAQAVYDGRNNLAVRSLHDGVPAQDLATAPTDDEKLTNETLRAWLTGAAAAADQERRGRDDSARARVYQDAVKLRGLTSEIEDLVGRIAHHADKVGDDKEGKPYVDQHGLSDPDEMGPRLSKLGDQLTKWHTVYEVRSGTADVLAGESA